MTRNLYRELRFRLPLRRSFDSHRLRLYPPADRLVGSAINWLSRRAQASPFLLWLHFMDPHHPYYPPAEALDSIGRPDLIGRQAAYLNSLWGSQDVSFHRLEKVREDVMALYRGGVLWVDMQISRLVRELQRLGQWDRTVFVVLGDHGEEFLEHRGRQHYPLSLHRELTHVPLMICHPALTDAHSVDLPFSLVDLAPTVLRMLGMPVPASFAGQSRWQNGRLISVPDQAVITEAVYDCCSPGDIAQRLQPRILSVQDAGFKLIMNFANDTEHFYDLASDPQEQVPLAANDRTPARRRMLSLALDHVRSTGTDLSNPDRLRARLADIRRRL